ncbi:MAG: SIR2 family protein [Planctomycetota bacterium]
MSRRKRPSKAKPPAAFSIADSPDLPALVNYIRAGRCALFVGAGLSVGAGLPTWSVLLERIVKATLPWAVEGKAFSELESLCCNWDGDETSRKRYARWVRRWYGTTREHALTEWQEEDSGVITSAWRERLITLVRNESLTLAEYRTLAEARRFPELASHCRELLGHERFFEVLRGALTSKERLAETHRDIVRTPWSCIVTTNFDRLLEDAFAKWGGRGVPKAPTGAELAQQGTLLLDGAFFILKAHGTLDEPESLIFTADDYRRVIHANPAFQAVLNAILLSHAVLFVGYSLSDPNFRLLFDQQLTTFRESVPPRYAIMPGIEQAEQEILWRTAKLKVFSYPPGQHEQVGQLLKALADRAAAPAAVAPALVKRGKKSASALTPRAPLGVPEPLTAARLQITADADRLDLRLQTAGGRDTAAIDWTGGAAWPVWPDFMKRLGRVIGQPLGVSSLADVNAVGAALSAILPDELEHRLAALRAGSVVRIACSAESEILPWEWMIVDGSPICLRNAVVRAPVGVSDRGRGLRVVAQPLRALVVGDAGDSSGASIHRLPGALKEARAVAKLIGAASGENHVTHLEQGEATYARLIHEVETGDYDIIHFAGHAWFSRDESQLYLWDGIVGASELGSLFNRRPPALLVLSTHHTAFVLPGLSERGEFVARNQLHPPGVDRTAPAVRGFAGMAMRAGVSAFLGCIASPGDEVCAQLVSRLYRELLDGAPVAFALREARRRTVQVNDITGMLFVLSGYAETRLTPGRGARLVIQST